MGLIGIVGTTAAMLLAAACVAMAAAVGVFVVPRIPANGGIRNGSLTTGRG